MGTHAHGHTRSSLIPNIYESVFFNYDDLDPNFPRPGYRAQCYSTELSFEDFFMFFTPTMDLTYYEEDQQLVRFQPPPCTDCTSFGPTEAPEYWIE